MEQKFINCYRAAKIAVERIAALEPGEKALIVTDTATDFLIPHSLLSAAAAAQADATMITMTPRALPNLPPPSCVTAAIRNSDVVFSAVNLPMAHSYEIITALLEYGVRWVSMHQQTPEMLGWDSIVKVDYEKLYNVTEQYAKRLSRGNLIRVTSKEGTDISASIRDFPHNIGAARAHWPGTWGNLPDGEAWGGMEDGTAEGTIVFDLAMHVLGFIKEPLLTLKVSKGEVVDILGAQARQLLDIISGIEGARHLAEVSIGTNPLCKVSDVCINENKFGAGRVHFAIGSDLFYGGSNKCAIHMDGVISKPTVTIDDEVIVDQGKLVLKGVA